MIGRTLGSYRVIEQIGMGGMATVYKAYDAGTDRHVAVKVLPEYHSTDPTFRERFQREARAIAKLEHPAILPVFAYGEEEGVSYLVMRYMPIGTLTDYLRERVPLPFREAARVLRGLASALDYAHRHGVLHRDVKPSNALLDADCNIYLSDFGIAKMLESTADLTGSAIIGTPQYMSPEQCQGGQPLTPASDQYSLGVILYEMVTGRRPFQAETPMAVIMMQLHDPLPPPRTLRPDLPDAAERAILKALAKAPEDRYPSCTALADAFNHAVESIVQAEAIPTLPDLPASTPSISALPMPVPSVSRRPRWLFGLLAALIVIAGIGVVLALGLPEERGGSSAGVTTQPRDAGTEPLAPATPTPAAVPGWIGEGMGRTVLPCGEDYLCVESENGASETIPLGRSFAFIEGLSWSPDGTHVAFGGCPSEQSDANPTCLDLFSVNAATGELVELRVDVTEDDKLPAWSPSGEWIAFHQSCGLSLIRPDGSDLRHLTDPGPSQRCMELAAWSPDSQHIAWIGGNGQGDTPAHSNRLYAINADGTGFRKLFELEDAQFAGNANDSLAWSPDGSSVVAMTRTGEVFQIDIACDADSNPCDPLTVPRLESFPAQWMHTFYPQWAGEVGAAPAGTNSAEAASNPAEAARAFGEPILAAIAGAPPSYEEDFSDPTSEWSVGAIGQGGTVAYVDGEYAFTASYLPPAQCCLTIMPASWPEYSDFVLEVDARFVSGEWGLWGLNFRHHRPTIQNPSVESMYGVAFSPFGEFMMNEVISGQVQQDFVNGQAATFRQGTETNHLTVMAIGPQMAIYLNGEPLWIVADDTTPSGSFSLWIMSDSQTTPIEVRYDNLWVWDVTDLDTGN